MFLILSGAYITQELSSEFGSIPPSFLPLGNRRLFQQQLKLVPPGRVIYMSVPDTYEILKDDRAWLENNHVQLIEICADLSLGESLVSTLNIIGQDVGRPLHILFGDTLLKTLPEGDDLIATAKAVENYKWSSVDNGKVNWLSNKNVESDYTKKNIVCGYFKFSQPRVLISSITKARWDFLSGLNNYHEKIGLTPIIVDDWLDFGHVNTYYHSKVEFTTQRSFNELRITPSWIEKSSVNSNKIQAEANWFNSIPGHMRLYIPQYLGAQHPINANFSYRLEYLHNTALNELYVFSEIPSPLWNSIISHCLDFIDDCYLCKAPNTNKGLSIASLFIDKTNQRLIEFMDSRDIHLHDIWNFNGIEDATIDDLLAMSKKWLPVNEQDSTLMHGDFCFSNILYDFRSNRIKTIDPRGVTSDGEHSIYGHSIYDIAKLSHSILGMYDWIVAGYHSTAIDWKNKKINFSISGERKHKNTHVTFLEIINNRYKLNALNLYAMQLQLFLSMLPLHADDINRQNGLFSNAFRIYSLMKGYEK